MQLPANVRQRANVIRHVVSIFIVVVFLKVCFELVVYHALNYRSRILRSDDRRGSRLRATAGGSLHDRSESGLDRDQWR